MATKAEWKERALKAELELRLGPPLVFDTFEVCWTQRTVTWQGRTVQAAEAECISFPVVTVADALQRRGMGR